MAHALCPSISLLLSLSDTKLHGCVSSLSSLLGQLEAVSRQQQAAAGVVPGWLMLLSDSSPAARSAAARAEQRRRRLRRCSRLSAAVSSLPCRMRSSRPCSRARGRVPL